MSPALRDRVDAAAMSPYQWLVVVLCIGLNMIDGFDVMVMAFTAQPVSAEWTLSQSRTGVLLSAGLFGMAGGSLLLAPLADRFGRRPLTIAALVVSGIGMFASAHAGTPETLQACRIVTGLGVGVILACTNVLASEFASARWRSLAVSLQSTGYALGATLGGYQARTLIATDGWRAVFAFGAIASAVALLAAVVLLPESLDFLATRRPAGARARLDRVLGRMRLPASTGAEWTPFAATADASATDASAAAAPRHPVAALFDATHRATTLRVWSSFFLVMAGFYFVMSWTPKLLAGAGLGAAQGVTAGTMLSIGGIFGAALLGAFASRLRLHHVEAGFLVVAAVLLGIFIGAAPGADAATTAYALSLLIGCFANGCVAGLYAIAPAVYGPAVRATGVGWGIGIGRLGAILAPAVAGTLLDHGAAPASLYLGFGALFVVAAVIVSMHRIGAPRS